MEPVKIGLLGLGTVGGGTVTVLTRNAAEIARRAGREIRIARAAAMQYNPEIHGLDQIGQIGNVPRIRRGEGRIIPRCRLRRGQPRGGE